ncbi:TPA: hypothetical protein ACM9EI_003674 [Escherichia coli]
MMPEKKTYAPPSELNSAYRMRKAGDWISDKLYLQNRKFLRENTLVWMKANNPGNTGNTGNTGNNKLCSGGCQHSQFLHLAVPDSVQINLFQPE